MPSNVSQQKVNTSTSQTSKTCPTLLKSQLSKATAVQKPIVVTGGKTKQDVIADATSTGPLTPWEGDVDRLIEGQRYSVTNLLVRTFQGKKHLSAPKHAVIEMNDDITDVASAESAESDSDSPTTLHEVQIIAVPVYKSYAACLTGKAKVEPKTATVEYCTKCAMPQRLDKCANQLSAKIIMQADTQQMTLQVFGPHLADICKVP